MLTFGFQLMSVFLDSNYNVMQFLGLKAIDGSWTKGFHHALWYVCLDGKISGFLASK